MSALHLFAPLRRQAGFPRTPVDIRINDFRYVLIVPPDISHLLVSHFIASETSYRCVDYDCDLEGVRAIRAHPTVLDDQYAGLPTYAVAVDSAEDTDDYAPAGYVAIHLLVGPLAARTLYRRAKRRKRIAPSLADYVNRCDLYFYSCGGFELLRIRPYFDVTDRLQVARDLDQPEPAPLSEGSSRHRFSSVRLRAQPR